MRGPRPARSLTGSCPRTNAGPWPGAAAGPGAAARHTRTESPIRYPAGPSNAAACRRCDCTSFPERRRMPRLFQTKYGFFTADGSEYVITRPDTPKPWVNVICPAEYGTVITQAGTGYSWMTHATLNRITRWEQDLVRDEWGKHTYCRDRRGGKLWSLAFQPVRAKPARYECRHGIGYTTITSLNAGIARARLSNTAAKWEDAIASLQVAVSLRPGEEKEIVFTLGLADTRAAALRLARRYQAPAAVDQAWDAMRAHWDSFLSPLEVK